VRNYLTGGKYYAKLMNMWKDIPDKNYQATENGEIRHKKFKRILKHFKGPHGYPSIQISNRVQPVHRLVLLAFRGFPPKGFESHHKNNNISDCRLENLKWISHKKNIEYKKEHGTENMGERNGLAKLTIENIKEIRRLYRPRSKKWNQKILAEKYGVSYQTIGFVIQGRTWKWVT